MTDTPPCLIVDLGSELLKAGICADEYQNTPYSNSQHKKGIPSVWKGESVSSSRVRIPGQIDKDGVMSRTVPCIERGTIVNTKRLENFLQNVYDEMLKVDPDDRGVVLTTPTSQSVHGRGISLTRRTARCASMHLKSVMHKGT